MGRAGLLVALSFLLGSILLRPNPAQAYPNFYSYGYASCLSCHFNPLGNGPLTDYGRAVSATAISAKPLFDRQASDDALAESSGFLGTRTKYLPDAVRPSAQYRGLLLASRLQEGPTWRRYHMRADAQLVLRTPEDRMVASGSIGYIPAPPGEPRLVSREHYLGARVGDRWGVYAGYFDVAYGLRIPDHESFSRSLTGLKQNDQTHGVLLHHTSDKTEGAVHAFLGNLMQAAALRPVGASATVEHEFWNKNRLGLSVLRSSNDFRSRTQASVHHRIRWREGSGVISELGVARIATVEPSTSLAPFLFVQGTHRFFRGFHGLATLEAASTQLFRSAARYYRVAPGVQWFALQRVELRLDFGGMWTRAVGGVSNDFRLDAMGQAALSF